MIREQPTHAAAGAWDWARLRSRCLREAHRVLPGADAEEAVQEALLRAWTRRDACRTPEAPLAWMLEITRNEARRLLGHHARSQRLAQEVLTARSAAMDDDQLAHAATRLTVARALARLEDADRDVLRLRYGLDLTQAEVACRLGIPLGTVKTRLHRARGRMRALLADNR
jgi:RNA polymerase sigma-70 factor, ECF subfamily